MLKGTFVLRHDGSKNRTQLPAGGFGYMPARMIHEAWTKDEGATYFITVDGKWDVRTPSVDRVGAYVQTYV